MSNIKWELTFEPISELKDNEVFVFGSNLEGIHGAGAAGMAFRGDGRNNYNSDPKFLLAKSSAEGHPNRVGKWAVFGQGSGPQKGYEGKSYAIPTVTSPGQRKSIPQRDIYIQLAHLVSFARERPELTFIITPLGEDRAGWGREDMQVVWETLEKNRGIPSNFKFVRMVK